MTSVVKVVLGWRFFADLYTTDGPGYLRILQVFRARFKTFLRLEPVPRPHVISDDRNSFLCQQEIPTKSSAELVI
ncbi:hypothetical protein [Lactiplantibacillus paraxiangfangensis]|uniref:hypothetical protein n=1 Tax=Lactiplantibacillus paraxiangfangensis TaxID=3076224 RepID=UPI0030C717F5